MDRLTRKTIRTIRISSLFGYKGSLFWLIFFLILWLPIGILLLVKNLIRHKNHKKYYLEYSGSWKWIFFWGLVFCPIAFISLVFKGTSLVEEEVVTILEE